MTQNITASEKTTTVNRDDQQVKGCKTRVFKMTNYTFTGKLGELVERAENGCEDDVDYM
jgi:hypothetical protein